MMINESQFVRLHLWNRAIEMEWKLKYISMVGNPSVGSE